MVFGESPIKDVYRKLIWGPYRERLSALPPGWELRANRALGRTAFRGARSKRASLRDNLARAFGTREGLDPIIQQTFETHFADQYISWTFSRIAQGEGDLYLDIQGKEHLDAYQDRGQGVVMMHPHMGPAQLPLCVLGAQGYRMNQVGGGGVVGELSETGMWATNLRHTLEKDVPAKIWDGGGFIRPVLRALKAGEVALSACDGTGGGRELGRRLPRRVLGQTMRVPVGPIYLALKAEVPLLSLHTFRTADGPRPYRSVIGPEIPLSRDKPLKEALADGADVIALHLDRWLRLHPGDWHFWDEFVPGRFLEAE